MTAVKEDEWVVGIVLRFDATTRSFQIILFVSHNYSHKTSIY